MRRFAVVVLSLAFPVSAFAATPVTREEGFRLLWNSINRPAVSTREVPFTDVPKSHPSFLEITYAKARGLVDETDEDGGPLFHPQSPLTADTAILWLLRTRNVYGPAELEQPGMEFAGYAREQGFGDFVVPHAEGESTVDNRSIDRDELSTMIREFDARLAAEDHEVSLYAEKFHGKGTAFGESFDMHALTAAHRTFPHNTLVKVTNIANGKSVTVRINDRGPYVEGRDMDLSLAAFTTIAERSKGKIRATFQRLGDVSLVGAAQSGGAGCGPVTYQRRLIRRTVLNPGIPTTLEIGGEVRFGANLPFTVREVRYPDGTGMTLDDAVERGETFTFKPSVEGEYGFVLADRDGKRKVVRMKVVKCKE